MGLGSNINDVSSADSVPLLFIAIIANCICYTRSIVFWVFKSFGFDVEFSFTDYDFDDHDHDGLVVHATDDHSLLNAAGLSNESTLNSSSSAAAVASSVLILKEQLLLNLNHQVYYYKDHHQEDDDRLQCIVCLCRLTDGEHVRQLGCKHIFHKGCLDRWLIDHFNSTCPLCRSPLVLLDSHQHQHHHDHLLLHHQQSIIPAF